MLHIVKKIAKEYHKRPIKRICFIHVPKCAGTSIVSAIDNSYSTLDRILFFKQGIDAPAAKEAAEILSLTEHEVRSTNMAYALAQDRNRFLHGHTHGLPEIIDRYRDKWMFVTILRQPIERWASEYVYNKYKSVNWKKVTLTIDKYLQSDIGLDAGKVFLNYFSSRSLDNDKKEDEFYFEQACHNLERFSVVGGVEELESWVEKFKINTGIRINIAKRNPSPNSKALTDLLSNPALREDMEKICYWDKKVYEFAMSLK